MQREASRKDRKKSWGEGILPLTCLLDVQVCARTRLAR